MSFKTEKNARMGAAGGSDIIAAANAVDTANYSYANSKTGHGLMAERALTVIDRLGFRDAERVGELNIKNGADRIVDGVQLQTKFYKSGSGCVNACFDSGEDGLYKYLGENGKLMQVEVPSDKYDDAVLEMREKISDGRVPGVTDPESADELVRRSALTYDNAVNLCKPLTWESLLYDCAIAAPYSLLIFAVSTVLTAVLRARTQHPVRSGIISGLKAFLLSFASGVFCAQVSRTSFFEALPRMSIHKGTVLEDNVALLSNSLSNAADCGIFSAGSAASRFSTMFMAWLAAGLITAAVFILAELVRLTARKISAAELMQNTAVIILAKLFGALFFASAAVLALSLTHLPSVISMIISVLSACAGGAAARYAVPIIKERIKKLKGAAYGGKV